MSSCLIVINAVGRRAPHKRNREGSTLQSKSQIGDLSTVFFRTFQALPTGTWQVTSKKGRFCLKRRKSLSKIFDTHDAEMLEVDRRLNGICIFETKCGEEAVNWLLDTWEDMTLE